MVEFFSVEDDSSAPPDWTGSTLLVPAVSIGNVGQLAVDLLVNTLKMTRIGVLESQYVLPSVGNDAYSASGTGALAVEMEIYECSGKGVYVMQQRSPVATGCQRRFASDFITWAKKCGFAKVLVLASIDSSFRKDYDIMGPQLRFVSSLESPDDACMGMGLQPLNPGDGGDGIEEKDRRTAPWPMLQESKEQELPTTALCMFASEGDNIPDALFMASAASQYLSLIPMEDRASFQWQPPGSWCNLYGPPVSDAIY